jgi:tRNA-specific adenosine deaminase 2
MNATNRTLNGTRHAEFMAIASILADTSSGPPGEKKYDPSILKESVLYVTVEPCIMCASLLRQYGIQKVYFGASNERFGGTGGVLRIHEGEGVEEGFEVSGGWLKEEAIMLLRRFYVQENGNGELFSFVVFGIFGW